MKKVSTVAAKHIHLHCLRTQKTNNPPHDMHTVNHLHDKPIEHTMTHTISELGRCSMPSARP